MEQTPFYTKIEEMLAMGDAYLNAAELEANSDKYFSALELYSQATVLATGPGSDHQISVNCLKRTAVPLFIDGSGSDTLDETYIRLLLYYMPDHSDALFCQALVHAANGDIHAAYRCVAITLFIRQMVERTTTRGNLAIITFYFTDNLISTFQSALGKLLKNNSDYDASELFACIDDYKLSDFKRKYKSRREATGVIPEVVENFQAPEPPVSVEEAVEADFDVEIEEFELEYQELEENTDNLPENIE